jgi:hypothetical protein
MDPTVGNQVKKYNMPDYYKVTITQYSSFYLFYGLQSGRGKNPSSADPIWRSPPSSTTMPYALSSIFGLEMSQMSEPCTVSVLSKDDSRIHNIVNI